MTDQKNTILAIVLSAIVLIAWQYFIGMPQLAKQKQETAQQQQAQQTAPPGQAPTTPVAPSVASRSPAHAGGPALPERTPRRSPQHPAGHRAADHPRRRARPIAARADRDPKPRRL